MISIVLNEISKKVAAGAGLAAGAVGARLLPDDIKQQAADAAYKGTEYLKGTAGDVKEKLSKLVTKVKDTAEDTAS